MEVIMKECAPRSGLVWSGLGLGLGLGPGPGQGLGWLAGWFVGLGWVGLVF